MPSISYDTLVHWSNYHLTLGKRLDFPHARSPHDLVPSVLLSDKGQIHTADIPEEQGLERFAETAQTLFSHLARVDYRAGHPLPTDFGEPMVGMVGRGWSFSGLIGAEFSQLECGGLSSVCEIPHDCAATGLDTSTVLMCGGGTRLRELVTWSEEHKNLTLKTSGTHLGLSVAGGFGTASHGSRLGFGGMQNLVLGMHLVVGPGQHVWIEDPDTPVLSEQGLAALAVNGVMPRVIRSKEMFEDVLIHLGCMGIVNAVALRMVPSKAFAQMRRKEFIDDAWLEALAHGDFDKIATRLKCQESPAFYELTIDPHEPMGTEAAHIGYFETDLPPTPNPPAPATRTADAIARFAQALKDKAPALVAGERGTPFLKDFEDPFEDISKSEEEAIRFILDGSESGFTFYRDKGKDPFVANNTPFEPKAPGTIRQPWSALHPDEITGGVPGSLYNASFSIERDNLADAIPLICDAVKHLPRTFVFTVRFVTNPRGTLAFTRFTENAVIEIDGLSPLICNLFALNAYANPGTMPEARFFRALASTVEDGAKAVRKALDGKIEYSMHWAKLGELNAAKVAADFGGSSNGDPSLIERWRTTREHLLGTTWSKRFKNPEVVKLGLV